MARGHGSRTTATGGVPRSRRLATDEARKRLYEIVNRMSRLERGEASLLERAIEVGPRGKGGALIIPAVDVEATLEEMREQGDQIEALHDEIEDLMLAQLVADRRDTPKEDLLTVEELAASVGRSRPVDDL